jgi:hypothetical protein
MRSFYWVFFFFYLVFRNHGCALFHIVKYLNDQNGNGTEPNANQRKCQLTRIPHRPYFKRGKAARFNRILDFAINNNFFVSKNWRFSHVVHDVASRRCLPLSQVYLIFKRPRSAVRGLILTLTIAVPEDSIHRVKNSKPHSIQLHYATRKRTKQIHVLRTCCFLCGLFISKYFNYWKMRCSSELMKRTKYALKAQQVFE